MYSPDSELKFFGREDSTQRRALAFHFVRLRVKLAEDPQVILAHSSMAPALASVSVITDTRMLQVVTDPLSYTGEGKYVATVKELDPKIFWELRGLPPDKRPPMGQEDAALIRITMQPRLVTTDFLINFVAAEINQAAPKPN